MIEGAGGGKRLGACLDSCHLLASGYDIRTPEGLSDVVDEFDRIVGLDRLGSLHVNDSMTSWGPTSTATPTSVPASWAARGSARSCPSRGSRACRASSRARARREGGRRRTSRTRGSCASGAEGAWPLSRSRSARAARTRSARCWRCGCVRSDHATTADTPERVAALLAAAPTRCSWPSSTARRRRRDRRLGRLARQLLPARGPARAPAARHRAPARRRRRGATAGQGSATRHRTRRVRRRRRGRLLGGRRLHACRHPVMGRMVRTL